MIFLRPMLRTGFAIPQEGAQALLARDGYFVSQKWFLVLE